MNRDNNFSRESQEVGDNLYTPSPLAHALMLPEESDYKKVDFGKAYSGNKKILIFCVEDSVLPCENGKNFLTGNNPIEMFVPMLHLQNAGFEMDIVTATGKPVCFEEWAMPEKDNEVITIRKKYQQELENPLSLPDVLETLQSSDDVPYAGLFIPGGHGAIIATPFDPNMKTLLAWATQNDLFLFSLCHGPAAFLASTIDAPNEDFFLNGRKITAFPDAMDKAIPYAGYLPGQLTWFFGKELEGHGVTVKGVVVTGRVVVDGKLITGDSPLAAQKLGVDMARALLTEYA